MKKIAKKIELSCHGIVVTLSGKSGGGSVTSLLHEPENPNVEGGSEEDTAHQRYEAMIDAIESLVLAHACAGIDIASAAYVKGIEGAINACSNNV